MIQVTYCGEPTLLKTIKASTSASASAGKRPAKVAPRHALTRAERATPRPRRASSGVMRAMTASTAAPVTWKVRMSAS